jgi:hypothetical protein
MGEVDADELARKIANRCGAGEVDGEFQHHGLGAGTMFTGEDKEVDLVKMEPLSGKAGSRAQAIAELRKSRSGREMALFAGLTVRYRQQPRPFWP